jgi:bifunctional DNA-binding transcriptional regulator/antitoxin component of YhaV-PrlF toxin-antitoxin module
MSEIIQTSVDSQGRIVIPSTFGNRLGLSKGMILVVEDGENNEFCLRVQKESPILVDKKGILVIKAESNTDLKNIIPRERNRRISELMEQTIHEDIT